MKNLLILIAIISAACTASYAQQDSAATDENVYTKNLEKDKAPDYLPGMYNSVVNNNPGSNPNQCTLMKSQWAERKIITFKNGYRIETLDKSEVLKVRQKSSGRKRIRYWSDTEDLKYHKKANGKDHYKYRYLEDCRKIKVKKNKNGITTTNHKSSLDWEKIRDRIAKVVEQGVSTCVVKR